MRYQYARPELRIIEAVVLPEDALEEVLRRWGLSTSLQEAVWVIGYDMARQVRSVTEIARGGYNETHVSIAAVMGAVHQMGVDHFILAHNHPSDNTSPSTEDVWLTKSVLEAANTCRLAFDDHVIVAPKASMYSFRGAGVLVPAAPQGEMAADG